MQRLNLGSADFKRYLEACALPHQIEVSVDLLTNDGDVVLSFDVGRAGDRDVVMIDGSVMVDATSLVGRILSLTVADPSGLLKVSQDANYTDRMLRVKVGVHVGSLAQVVYAHVFTGPIISAPRSGDVVVFTAHGKARFAQHGLGEKYVIRKGTRKTTAIRNILHDLAGEPLSSMGGLPDLPPTVSKDHVLDLSDRPWAVCRDLAASLTRHLQYDGPGQLRAQRTDLKDPVYTFTSAFAQPGVVSDPPLAQTDWSTIKNAVRVKGGATETSPPPVAYAYADPSNPFSAQKLGRNGSLAYLWDFVEVESAHTLSAVQRIADNTLERDLIANRELKFESVPMYVFDEMDLVQVDTNELTAQTRLAKFTVPLNIEGAPTMSYGWNARRSSDRFAAKR